MDFRQKSDKVLKRPTQPIDRPGYDQVELALGGVPA